MIINGLMCEYENCNKGLNGVPKQVAWDTDGVRKNPAAMPDNYYGFCNWQPNYEENSDLSQPQRVFTFCSRECNYKFLRNLSDPRSPSELAQQEEVNRQVEAKKNKQSINGQTDGMLQVGTA